MEPMMILETLFNYSVSFLFAQSVMLLMVFYFFACG